MDEQKHLKFQSGMVTIRIHYLPTDFGFGTAAQHLDVLFVLEVLHSIRGRTTL